MPEPVLSPEPARETVAPAAPPPPRPEPAAPSAWSRSAPRPVLRVASPVAPMAPVAEPPEGVDAHLVSLLSPTTFEAEQYRTLRHMIEQLHASAQVSVVACTSPAGGDGKTTTAINLAGALAQAPDMKVLLVDADLRRPMVAEALTMTSDAGPGLVGGILQRELSLGDLVRTRAPFNLSIVPAGRMSTNPYELLQSPRFAELLVEARRDYDYVIVDTPPLVSIPDCRAIARSVDGFVVVVAAHRTPRKMLEEALTVVDLAKVIGLVYNRDDRPLGAYYSYGPAVPQGGDPGGRGRALLPFGRGGRSR